MDFNDKIAPFSWIKHEDGSSSVALYASKMYKKELFQARRNDGFTGSGYDWESLAQTLIKEMAPDLRDVILFDSEHGMFCAYSNNADELRRFVILLKETCENDSVVADLFSRAAPDEFVADSKFLNTQEQFGNLFERLSLVTPNNLPSEEEIIDMKNIIEKMQEEI